MRTDKLTSLMKIEDTHYGKKITIPDYGFNSEFVFEIRNVKVLNGCFDEQHPLIDVLARKENKIYKKLISRLQEMDHVFTILANDKEYIKKFENRKNVDFNEYFHDAIDEYIRQIDNISYRYSELAIADGYSYCI